jgi:hypothetical protein
MRTIAIDPSGNFEEGKGHTGIAIIDDNDWENVKVLSISAKDFLSRHSYWWNIIHTLGRNSKLGETQVVIESYVTRMNGFTIGKQSETAMLIGVIVYRCEQLEIPYTFQAPSAAKSRFKDELLPKYYPKLVLDTSTGKNRYLYDGKLISDHIRDAMKHLLYFKRYKEK